MATVGIVGGLGPESTIDYYRRMLDAWERGLALLGTRFTMDTPFYPTVCGRYGIAVVLPSDVDRGVGARAVHRRTSQR